MIRIFCTCVTSNYLEFIGPLRKSLTESGNFEKLVVLIADFDIKQENTPHDGIELISLKEIGDALVKDMTIYFGPRELPNALKPFCIEYVLQNNNVSEVIYIDSDLFFVDKLPDIFSKDLSNKKVVYTPHVITTGTLYERIPKEIDIVDMGILNGGFIAVKNHPSTFSILNWMKERFAHFGFDDRKNGYFLDQKILPLLLTIFPSEVGINFNNCLNVAFWNAHERDVEEKNGLFFIDNNRVVFFHMSGVSLKNGPMEVCYYLSKEENQKILTRSPWLYSVLKSYKVLLENFSNRISNWPFRFTSYNGVAMFPELRRHFFETRKIEKFSLPETKLIIIHKLKLINRQLRKYFQN